MFSLRLARMAAPVAGAAVLVLLAAIPVHAQYGRPMMTDPAVGEKYHVEAIISFWRPSLDATVTSESLGILGDPVDVKPDLGYEDKTIREFKFVLRPGRKHKFRIQRTPVEYEGDVILERSIVFNGIEFDVGLPVQSEFKWNTWRFGYEYDFVYRDRGYVGFILEVRYTDAELALRSPIDDEFTRARGPIPAFGGIARGYLTKNFSITGEVTGTKVPQIDEYEGSLLDIDIYGTLNFNHHVGVQGGYRRLDASYLAESDTGDLQLNGLYFSGVARF